MSLLDLAVIQLGGSGYSICQCMNATIRTTKPIPMQVDGEPRLMKPCTIYMGLDPYISEAKMLSCDKNAKCKLISKNIAVFNNIFMSYRVVHSN